MKFKDLDKSVRVAFYAMGVVFVFLIIATGITIYIANKDHEDVIDRNYYEKGLNYEKTFEDNRIMEAEGYLLDSPFFTDRFPLTQGKNSVQIRFTKKEEPILDSKIWIVRERGATKKFNETFTFAPTSNGNYVGNVDIPELGQWVFTVFASHGNRTYKKTIQFVVQR